LAKLKRIKHYFTKEIKSDVILKGFYPNEYRADKLPNHYQ